MRAELYSVRVRLEEAMRWIPALEQIRLLTQLSDSQLSAYMFPGVLISVQNMISKNFTAQEH